MKVEALFLFIMLFPSWLFAQVQGTIYDAETKQPIPDVVVNTIVNKTNSNQKGYFSLPVSSQKGKDVEISLSHPQYHDTILVIQQPVVLVLYFKPAAIKLKEVEVIAAESNGTETSTLTRKELENINKHLGEADLVKAMQYKPGVLQTGETQAGLFIRGGRNSQTAILLQGIPIFNSAHLLGINSSLDPDAYESVTLTTGGFSASEGGWLSAYLQAVPRATNLSGHQLKFGVGVMSSEIGYQKHLPRYKTSIFVKAKSSYYQLVAKAYEQLLHKNEQSNPLPDYSFNDLNLQVNTNLPKGSFSVALFGSQDKYEDNTNRFLLASHWGNRILSTRWKHRLGPAWLEVTQGYSQYAFSMKHQRQVADFIDQKTSGYFSNLLFGLPLKNRRYIEAGAFLHYMQAAVNSSHEDKENRLLKKDTFTEKLTLSGLFTQIHIEDNKLSYTAGFRSYLHEHKVLLAPRMKIRFTENNLVSSVYYDRTYQFHHQVNVLGISMPFDFFRFTSERLPMQQSDQVGLSVSKSIKQHKLSLGIYNRWLNGQLYYGNATELLTNFDTDFKSHKGKAYGLEMELQTTWNKISFTLGYTLAYSKLALEKENGKIIWGYPVQDVRHQTTSTFQYTFNAHWQLTAQWFLQTGSPYTFPVGIIPAQGMMPQAEPKIIPFFEEYNNVRTPIRHRLDLGVTYKKQHKKSASEWNFGIYNAYNHANPYFLYFSINRQEDGTDKIIAKQRSLLPLTPTLRYTCTLDL